MVSRVGDKERIRQMLRVRKDIKLGFDAHWGRRHLHFPIPEMMFRSWALWNNFSEELFPS